MQIVRIIDCSPGNDNITAHRFTHRHDVYGFTPTRSWRLYRKADNISVSEWQITAIASYTFFGCRYPILYKSKSTG